MAADFMVQQALFHNRIFLLFFLFFIACKQQNQHAINFSIVNRQDENLHWVNGMMKKNDTMFSGTVYTLYSGTIDTAEILNFLNGKENGIWKKFYETGKLKEKREYLNGLKEGEYIAFWENGNKRLQYFFKEDEYEGTCREWNEDEIMIREMNYKKGYEEGSQKLFYDNGKTRANYVILNGRRYGLLGTKNCANVSDSVFKN